MISGKSMKVDKIYCNGIFYTMEKEGDIAEAIAVSQGKIIAIGSNKELLGMRAKEVIDLKGASVIPGMADAHMHLYLECLSKTVLDLSDCKSIEEVIERCKTKIDKIPEGGWLLAENLHMDSLKEKRFLFKEEVDQISTKIAICLGSFCHHVHMLNTKAMDICGIKEVSQEVVEKTLDTDGAGIPNGVVRDQSYSELVEPFIPTRGMEETIQLMHEYLNECAAMGITQLHVYQEDNPDGIRMYQELRKKYGLPCRLTFNFIEDEDKKGIVTGFGDEVLKIGAVKFLMDGSVGAATCLMNEEFTDKPGEFGQAAYTQEMLNDAVKRAYDAGNDVAVHAIGDKANDMLLTAIEYAWDPNLEDSRRFYIIHATIISDTFVERAKKLPVIISVQPIFMRNFAGMSKQRIGLEREEKMFALRSMMDGGLLLTGSSDAPVREVNPFHGIYCSVARKNMSETPESFAPSQAITMYEAVSMYTKNAAYHVHEEHLKGTISQGKVADFIVLDRDIFHINVEKVADTKVVRTVMNGEETYIMSDKQKK